MVRLSVGTFAIKVYQEIPGDNQEVSDEDLGDCVHA